MYPIDIGTPSAGGVKNKNCCHFDTFILIQKFTGIYGISMNLFEASLTIFFQVKNSNIQIMIEYTGFHHI